MVKARLAENEQFELGVTKKNLQFEKSGAIISFLTLSEQWCVDIIIIIITIINYYYYYYYYCYY